MNNESSDVEIKIADSRLAFVQGKYEEALKLAKQALSEDPKNADAHQCAGNAYMSKSDLSSAINHYKKAVENDSDNGDRYFNLGYAYAADNQPVKALEMFAKADEVGSSPNVVGQLYKIMGMLCFDMHKYDDAVLNFIKSEKVIGIDMDILQRKALCYSMSGDTSAGIEVANQMKILAPTNYLGYRIAFNILLQEERFDEAENELDRAERFAKPTGELFADWTAYQTALYEQDGDKVHLNKALDKIFDGLCVAELDVDMVVQNYVNSAELYIQLENADMAIHCLNAAENPVESFNSEFAVKEVPEINEKRVGKPSKREIEHAILEVRRKYGDRHLEMIGREMTRNAGRSAPDIDKYITPLDDKPQEEEKLPTLPDDAKPTDSQEIKDRINRLYIAAYTIKKDTARIKMYASELASSPDNHSAYIGKYSLVKALKEEGHEKADEEYNDLIKYFRNQLIIDPTDMLALNFRVQCLVDLHRFDEAEQLCDMLSDQFAEPLREQIEKEKAGGDS